MNLKQKLLAIKNEIAISKDAKNNHLKYDYATLSNMLSNINKVASKHNVLFTIQIRLNVEMSSITNKLFYDGVVTVYDVETEETMVFTYSFPSDTAQKNNDIQAFGSTMTYSQRYMLGSLLGIAYDDEDPDHDKNMVKTTYKNTLSNDDNKIIEKMQNKDNLISESQSKRLYAIFKSKNIDTSIMISILKKYGYNNSKEIQSKDYDSIIKEIESV